ncbi:MAG TPA: hypothetical protein VG370_20030, partial [Chloroflexota bacterium]|nr:hypothetical protein [Chloroflexota bacterium]
MAESGRRALVTPVVPVARRGERSTGTSIGRRLVRVIVGAYCFSSIAALLWAVYTSFKSDRDLFGHGPWALPEAWHPENYVDVWSRSRIGNYFLNSAYLSILATIGGVIVAAMAAYV